MISNFIKTQDVQSIPEKTITMEHSEEADTERDLVRSAFDRKVALERTMRDEKSLSDLLQEFIEFLPEIKKRIINAIIYKNASTLAKETNLLTRSERNFGALGLSDAAFDFEIESLKGLIAELNRSYRKLEQEVNSFIEYAQND